MNFLCSKKLMFMTILMKAVVDTLRNYADDIESENTNISD
jgi:hypothetical protein